MLIQYYFLPKHTLQLSAFHLKMQMMAQSLYSTLQALQCLAKFILHNLEDFKVLSLDSINFNNLTRYILIKQLILLVTFYLTLMSKQKAYSQMNHILMHPIIMCNSYQRLKWEFQIHGLDKQYSNAIHMQDRMCLTQLVLKDCDYQQVIWFLLIAAIQSVT